MNINRDRLKQHFEVIREISATQEGQTRFSYSREDRKVRDYILGRLEDLGLRVTVDFVGNIRAVYDPNNLQTPSVMTGSHIDTVRNGGLYDGLLGVLSALETIETIKEQAEELDHPVELVIFAEEEGSNFNCTMMGSKIMTGKLDVADLKTLKNDQGTTAFEIIEQAGYGGNPVRPLKPGEVKALIEYHIEQGGVLEAEGKSVGVVRAIAGMKTKQVTLVGVSNHAGTTPMPLRKDPLVAAGKVISELADVPRERNLDTAVVTVGKIMVRPNASNVIPKEAVFTVDIRDVTEEGIGVIEEALQDLVKKHSMDRGVQAEILEVAHSDIVRLSSAVIEVIEDSAKKSSVDYLTMNSGAVHDCAMLAKHTEIGMIFVPSIGGISHSPEEDTAFQDIVNGANLLLHSVLALAAPKRSNL